MHVLGIGGTGHNYAACLLTDGVVRYAVEEERLNRIKHSLLPEKSRQLARCRAAAYCLDAAGLQPEQIELAVTTDNINKLYYVKHDVRTVRMPHHLAHASSAFYTSPFEEAAVLVVDACGSLLGRRRHSEPEEAETISYYYASGKQIREIRKVTGSMMSAIFPYNSVGEFYHKITAALGFQLLDEEKIMWLAAYGSPRFVSDFERFYEMSDNGQFVRGEAHVKAMDRFLNRVLSEAATEAQRFAVTADVAFAARHHLENVLVRACRFLQAETRTKHLCLAGDIFLNSSVNYRLMTDSPFDDVYVFPQPGDAGTAIGCALYGYHIYRDRPRAAYGMRFSPYLGRQWSADEMAATLRRYADRIQIVNADQPYRAIAGYLAEGAIVGWMNGRSEIGRKALGNRSILADPRSIRTGDDIRARVKRRERFHPFASVIMEEHRHQYYEFDEPSRYMLVNAPIREDKLEQLKAVSHVDGTGRFQTVSKETNEPLYAVLRAFYERTGVPALLNTSLNEAGHPMAESPEDAVNVFLQTDLDYLVLDGMIIRRKRRDDEPDRFETAVSHKTSSPS